LGAISPVSGTGRNYHHPERSKLHVIFHNWFTGKKCQPFFAPFDIKIKLEITVDLRSFLREPGYITLGEFLGLRRQQWWSSANEEELNQGFKEILEIMDKHGWDWFVLK
jgi:hypothetical protein